MIIELEEVPRDFYDLSGQKEAPLDQYGYANFTGTRVTAPYSDDPYFVNVSFILNDKKIMETEQFLIYIRNCTVGEKLIDP